MNEKTKQENFLDTLYTEVDNIQFIADRLDSLGHNFHRLGMSELSDEMTEYSFAIRVSTKNLRSAYSKHLNGEVKKINGQIGGILTKVIENGDKNV